MSEILRDAIERFVSDSRPKGVLTLDAVVIGTNVGQVRKENQDRVLYIESESCSASKRNYRLAVVADGMGGLASGSEAADLAISSFVAEFHGSEEGSPELRLAQAANAANRQVNQRLRGKGGATIAAVLMDSTPNPIALTVGDSRVYALTDSDDILQISRDDTIGEVLKARPNDIDPFFDQRLIQFVGMGEDVEPNIYVVDRHRLRSMLITSDGAHGIGKEVLRRLALVRGDQPGFVEALLSVSAAFGGTDNATAALIPIRAVALPDSGPDWLRIYGTHGTLNFCELPRGSLSETVGGSPEDLESAAPLEKTLPPKEDQHVKKRVRKKKVLVDKGPGELDFDFPGDES